jgi:L-ribulose-5-phosphate 3-epimerase
MEKWPIGVFTSVDAGLGVKLEVAHELGVRHSIDGCVRRV